MNFVDLVILAVVVIAAFRLGQYSVIWPLRHAVSRLRERGIDLEQLLKEEALKLSEQDSDRTDTNSEHTASEPISVERIQGIYYAWTLDREFLAQSQDFRSLNTELSQRWPQRRFHVEHYDPALSAEEQQQLARSILENQRDHS